MACNSSPTATLFDTSTSESVSTSISRSVSGASDSVTTIQSTKCVATTTGSDNSTTCAETSTINQVSTIGGDQTTVEVTVLVTNDVVQSFATQTLFATCGKTTSDSSPVSTPTTSPKPTSTPPKTSVIVTVTTPPPLVKTSATSTTLANGSVLLTTTVVTSSVSPSSVTSTVVATSSHQQVQASGGASHSNVQLGPIIGGSVGGFFALLALVGVIWLIMRKRGSSWDDIFERDVDGPIDFHPSRLVRDPNTSMSLDMGSEMEPKPYQYGLVGPSITPPFASPPGSPTDNFYPQYMMHDNGRGYHNGNHSYSPDQNRYMHDSRRSFSPEYNQHRRQYSADHIETQHNRRPSATSLLYTPLMLPNTANTAISPEPSMASVYSQATSRPDYSRAPSATSGSRPPTGNSRLSTDGSSVSRTSTRNSAQMPQGPRRLRRPSRPDAARSPTPERSTRPPSGYDQGGAARRPSPRRSGSDPPLSPRTLTLANWNQSTDAISFDAGHPSRTSMGSRDQPRGAHRIPSSVPSGSNIPAGMARGTFGVAASNVPPARARANTSDTVIMHTDGGTVRENALPREVKHIPAEAPPAYS